MSEYDYIFLVVCIVILLVFIFGFCFRRRCVWSFSNYDHFYKVVRRSTYFGNLSQADLARRRVSHGYKDVYLKGWESFSSDEQDYIDRITNEAVRLLPVGIVTDIEWTYEKINADLELGLPHTLGDRSGAIIVLNSNVFSIPRADLLEIICHEIVHIYQRFHESDYIKMVESMGFVKADHLAKHVEHLPIAANPDTWGLYSYKGKLLLSVYDAGENIDILYDPFTHEIIRPNKGIQKDHPFEILACLIARQACATKWK